MTVRPFQCIALGMMMLGGSVGILSADPLATIRKYSRIDSVDLTKLAEGAILGNRIPAQGSDLTITVEALFAVPLPPAKVVDLMEDSVSATTVSASDTLDVENHHPVGVPPKLENFAALKIKADDEASRSLINDSATGKGLNLNAVEADMLAKADSAEKIEKVWRQILVNRAKTFQTRGWVGSAPYDNQGRGFSMHQEMVRLLKSQPALLDRFQTTIGAAMTGKLVSGMPAPGYFWEGSRIQGDRVFMLAAIFSRKLDGGAYQVVEPTYYVTSKYFTSVILYEVHPITIQGKPYSLIWRGDLIITPSINFVKGIERMAAENITLLEVRKSVKSFAEECRAKK